MFGIFGFILIILLIIIIIGVSLILGVLRFLFGFTRKGKQQVNYSSEDKERENNESAEYSSSKKESTTKKKIFDKDEGEYVDYEEVDD